MNYPQTNTVHYHLYRKSCSPDYYSIIDHYFEHLAGYLNGYIWHNECFHLKQQKKSFDHRNIIDQQYLFGQCNYGENIEDEWFIVFLLKMLTEFDENLFVRIQDEDGEFLLIESAEHLPGWAQEPHRTIDRVFIHRGNIHLVSSKYVKKDSSALNKFSQDCIDFIRSNPNKTECNESIQQCIRNRIEIFSHNLDKLHHNARCSLPISLAILLDHHPELIAAAVRAFYYRTPDDVKIIGTHQFYSSDNQTATIITNVRFNRCLYAQLVSQDVTDVRKLLLPSSSNEDRIHQNGAKIIAGFEILLKNYQRMKSSMDSENFEKNFASAAKRVHEFLTITLTDELTSKFLEHRSLPSEDDDDSWLNIDEEQFDRLLSVKFNQQQPSSSSSATKEEIVKNIPETLMKFFQNQNAGLDGVEPPPPSPLQPKAANESKSTKSFDLIKEFNEKEFVEFMEKMAILESEDFSDESENDDDTDTDDDDDDDDDDDSNRLPEMEAYIAKMDSELAQTILANSFERAPKELDSDDDDDDNEENDLKYNAVSNILKSLHEEIETTDSDVVGPATALFAYMNQSLPELKINQSDKKNLLKK